MSKQAYVFLGMAIQALIVAGLQAFNLITVTPMQQGGPECFFSPLLASPPRYPAGKTQDPSMSINGFFSLLKNRSEKITRIFP